MIRSNIDDLVICDAVKELNGYNYYGYLSSGENSRSLIIRENVAETEYRYFFGKGSNYAVDFAGKESLNFVLPNALLGKE